MKILHVVGSYYPSQQGGPCNSVHDLAKALIARGHEVKVLTTNYDIKNDTEIRFDRWQEIDGVPVYYASVLRNQTLWGIDTSTYLKPWKVLKPIHRAHPQICHVNMPYVGMCHFAALTAKRLGIPVVWSTHGALLPYSFSRGAWKKKLFLRMGWVKDSLADCTFHVTSQEEADETVRQIGMFVGHERIGTIVNAPIFFAMSDNLKTVSTCELDIPFFLHLGRVHPKKNIESLIEAMALLVDFPEIKLVIAGDVKEAPEYSLKLKALVKSHNLQGRVTFTERRIEGEEKQRLYAGATAFVLPSHSENFGMVVVESLALGTPVIASKQTPWEILEKKNAGYWVDNDPKSLAIAMRHYLCQNEKGKNSMRQEALNLARDYNDEQLVQRYIAMYEDMLETKNQKRRKTALQKRAAYNHIRNIVRSDLQVLFAIGSFYPSQQGGPCNSVFYLAQALVKNGVRVRVLTTNYDIGPDSGISFNNWVEIDGVETYYMDFPQARSPLMFDLKMIANQEQVYNIVAAETFDIAHTTMLYSTFAHLGATCAKMRGNSVIWSPRGSMLPYTMERGQMKKRIYLRLPSIRIGMEDAFYHATSPEETAEIRTFVKKYTGEEVADRIYQIPNTVGSEVYDKPAQEIRNQGRYWLHLGRIHPKKNIESLIESLVLLKDTSDTRLIIAGDAAEMPEYTRKLKELVNFHNLDTEVTFTECRVEGDEKRQLYAGAVAFVLPSHSENFGMVVVESLAQGTPVIASKNTPWEILEKKGAGYWVDNDPISLANALRRFLYQTPEELKIMSAQAVTLAQSYSDEKMVGRYIEMYEDILAKRNK